MKFTEILPRFLLIAVLAVIIYSNSFNASWHLDDYPSIIENYKIKTLSEGFKNIILNPRGICDLSFALNYYFGGADVFGFHIVNLAIHILSAFMVYFLIMLTFERLGNNGYKNLPLAGSILFVAHPIQTQAVTYIVQRYTSLVTMFYLIALVLFIQARMNLLQRNVAFFSKYHFLFYLSSLLSSLLAMRTKEIAVTIPVIFLLYDSIFFKKGKKGLRDSLVYLLPYFTLLLIILILRIFFVSPDFTGLGEAIDRSFKDTAQISRIEYAFTSINVLLTYIRLLFLPINQNIYYVYPISKSVFSNYLYLSLLFHIGIIISAILIFKKSRLISFGIFWFYITICVESSIIPIRDVIFEHRLYLPSVGFVLSTVGLISLKFERKRILCILFSIIIFIFCIASYNRNIVWQNELTLWTDCLRKSPNSSLARNNLGVAYGKLGRYEEAIDAYKQAIRIKPDSAKAHSNLGLAYSELGRYKEAIVACKKAIRIKPDLADAHYNLGLAYGKLGRYKEAIDAYKQAIRIKPDLAKAHNNLGLAYSKLGRNKEEIDVLKQAIRIKPDYAEAQYNLGNNYFKLGRYEEAIDVYKQAIRIKPDLAKVHNNLGLAYSELGRYEKAIDACKQAIRIKPDYADAYNNLGATYGKLGRYEEAIDVYKQAIRIKPDLADTYFNLGLAYVKLGRNQEAIDAYKQAIRIKPDLADAHLSLGLAYGRLSRYEEAIDVLKRAIRIKPDLADAHYNLGLAYGKLGRNQEAIDVLEQAIRIKPDYAKAHRLLGAIYLLTKDKEAALEEYKILKTLDQNLANELVNLINR